MMEVCCFDLQMGRPPGTSAPLILCLSATSPAAALSQTVWRTQRMSCGLLKRLPALTQNGGYKLSLSICSVYPCLSHAVKLFKRFHSRVSLYIYIYTHFFFRFQLWIYWALYFFQIVLSSKTNILWPNKSSEYRSYSGSMLFSFWFKVWNKAYNIRSRSIYS